MVTRLVPLGINGFIPSYGRQTMSFLVLTETEALLLDAGTGMGRLLEEGIKHLLEPYDYLNVVLSHYHLDHVVGLSYLPGIWAKRRIRLYAPGLPFVEVTPEEAFGRLLNPPLLSLALQDFPMPVEVIPLTRENVQIGNLSVRLRAQNHPGGSMGIRIEDRLAYITDTPVDDVTAEFAQGVGLLLHEVWLTDIEAKIEEAERSRHSYVSGVVQIGLRANVSTLMPIHHHPKRSKTEIDELARKMGGLARIDIEVPREGQIYQLK